jgi:hypothetical protein
MPFASSAQEYYKDQINSDTTNVDSCRIPRVIIKFAPLSLIDFYSSIQAGVEFRLSPLVGLQTELGYIMPLTGNLIYDYEQYKRMTGVRSRNEIRFYLGNSFIDGEQYLALEAMFTRVRFQREGIFGFNCGTFECDYFEKSHYSLVQNIKAFHVKYGFQNINYKNIVFDFYGGVGIRSVEVLTVDKPEATQFRRPLFWNGENIVTVWPSLSFGVKVGYVLNYYKSEKFHKKKRSLDNWLNNIIY